MRRFLIELMVLVLVAVSGQALAARQKVDQTKDAAADGFVHILVVRGRLKVEGWDQDKIQVSGLLDEQTKEFVFNVDKDSSTVDVQLPRSIGGWCCSEGSDLVVQVPKGSRVDVSVVSTDTGIRNVQGGLEVGTVSGDLNVENVKDRVDLTSVSGDVELREATGRIGIKAVSGDVHVYDSNGNIKLHTVSGDVVAHNVSNEFEFESISGDVEADNVTWKQVSGNTVSGDVEIGGTMSPDGSVDFDSVSGSVRLSFKGDVDARFDLEASSGSIRNGLTDDRPQVSKYSSNETLRFIKGSGKGEVTVSTRSGDIVLSKR